MFLDWKDVDTEDVLLTLISCKEHLENQSVWIDYGLAFNKFELPVPSNSKDAVKFSLMGSIEKSAQTLWDKPKSNYVDCATREYLMNLSDSLIWKSTFSYDYELKLIEDAIESLTNEVG